MQLTASFDIFQATQKEQGPREFSYSTVKITIQIQHFAENYGKQTPKEILLSNEKCLVATPNRLLRGMRIVCKSGPVYSGSKNSLPSNFAQ